MRTSSEIPFTEQFGTHPKWKVSALCEKLGWSSVDRPANTLSDATLTYRRRKFVGEQDLPLILHCDNPTVELCAKYFCRSDRREKFFPKTPEAIANKWPTWPEDKDLLVTPYYKVFLWPNKSIYRIIEYLAKLIWLQEYNQRRNAESNEKREGKKVTGQNAPNKLKPVKSVTPKKLSPRRSINTGETIERDHDYTPIPKPAKPVSMTYVKREDIKLEDPLDRRNVEDREKSLQFNMNENLDWIYPLKLKIERQYPICDISHKEVIDGPESICWIFQVRVTFKYSFCILIKF